jgi:hypothetical protein
VDARGGDEGRDRRSGNWRRGIRWSSKPSRRRSDGGRTGERRSGAKRQASSRPFRRELDAGLTPFVAATAAISAAANKALVATKAVISAADEPLAAAEEKVRKIRSELRKP